MKKITTLIVLGILNIVHGLSHIIQLIQSVFLASYGMNHNHHDNWYTKMMESPVMSVFWICIGILTIYIGIRDFRHHVKHKD